MTATSLHDDVLFNSKERHERATHCSSVHLDWLVEGVGSARGGRDGKKGIGLVRTPRTDEMEPSARCGRRFSRKELDCRGIEKERSRWCLIWLKHSSASVFQLCGLGRLMSTFPRKTLLVLCGYIQLSLFVVWVWVAHFSCPRKILRVPCGYFEHQRRVQFEGCVAQPLQTITAIFPGSI